MVCSPHRYIVSGIAQGISQTTTRSDYGIPLYSRAYQIKPTYQQNYETKTAMSARYGLALTYVFSPENNSDRIKSTAPSYYGTPAITPQQFDSPTTRTASFDSPIDLSPAHIIRTEQQLEAQQMNDQLRKKKQTLAQLIMHERDALGPREEHTHENDASAHEHGDHIHVH